MGEQVTHEAAHLHQADVGKVRAPLVPDDARRAALGSGCQLVSRLFAGKGPTLALRVVAIAEGVAGVKAAVTPHHRVAAVVVAAVVRPGQ